VANQLTPYNLGTLREDGCGRIPPHLQCPRPLVCAFGAPLPSDNHQHNKPLQSISNLTSDCLVDCLILWWETVARTR